MKIFSAHAKSESSSREIARGCFTTNLVIPGLGSLTGGRKIGYLQLVLCYAGQGVTLVFGIRLILWFLAHWSEIYRPNAEDPLASLREIWPHFRLPLLGIVLFAVAWFWALLTSCQLLKEAKRKGEPD
jgi:hypothetical protein